MSLNFDRVLEQLALVDWTDDVVAEGQTVDVLRELDSSRELLVREIEGWPQSRLEDIAERSHETATHYKWFIARDSARHYTIWLHQYKPRHLRRAGHANTAHNHRYGFASLVMVGGFTQVEYRLGEDGPSRIHETRRVQLRAGDVFVVHPDQIHQMMDILDSTMTVVIERRPRRNHSEVFDLDHGGVTRFPDFLGQYPSLVSALGLVRDPTASSATPPV